MKINIKDKEVELKYSIRVLLMYENITGKTFESSSITNLITFFYCVVVYSANDYSIMLDEFITWIDENDGVLVEFGNWLTATNDTNSKLKKK